MFNELKAVLHSKWDKSISENNVIYGYWAEDNSKYVITCPHQLRDSIVLMQNWLCNKSKMWYDLKSEVQKIERWFNS